MNNATDATATVEAVLTSQKIPDLEPQQMSALLHYMFHSASASLRIRVAEVVFRHERAHRPRIGLVSRLCIAFGRESSPPPSGPVPASFGVANRGHV